MTSLLAFAWCGLTFLEAEVFQAYANWRLDKALQGKPASSLVSALHPVRSGGKTTVPRLSGIEESPTLTTGRKPVHNLSPSVPSAIATVDPWLLGRLEIPRIGLSAIISEGSDSRTLRRALGHIPGTAVPGEMGNVGIAGHRDTFFHKLQHIHRHDIIILVTARNTYRYWVQCTMVVDPTCTEVLNKTSKPALTLVTCYPFNYLGPAPKRFIVRAQRMDS